MGLKTLVESHAGNVRQLFNQGQYDISPMKTLYTTGACFGLSIMWLKFQSTPVESQQFAQIMDQLHTEARGRLERISEFDLPMFRSRDPFISYVRELHDSQTYSPLYGNALPDFITKMRTFGLECIGQKDFGGGWGKGHTDLGHYVSAKGTGSLINAHGHAMAACNMQQGVQFFDPNWGVAEFPNAGKLGKFLSDFFKLDEYLHEGVTGKLMVKAFKFRLIPASVTQTGKTEQALGTFFTPS